MKVSPEELRNFAGSLDPDGLRADLSGSGEEVASLRIDSAMQETHDPNNFIAAWGPLLARTATDLARCVGTLSTVASTAADQFETTDGNHALIMRKLLEQAHGGESSVDPETLSEAPTTRAGGDLPNRPEDESNEVASRYGNLGGGIPRPQVGAGG